MRSCFGCRLKVRNTHWILSHSYGLSTSPWIFSYFSDDFAFQDPDVKVNGIEGMLSIRHTIWSKYSSICANSPFAATTSLFVFADYARGVNKIFDQSTARAEIISTVVNTEASKPTITVTWWLSGGVNIAWGLNIKPYIVYTDFVVDPTTSLIVFQEDKFDLPSWDIFLSFLFPFLIGKVTAEPAPPVPKRQVEMPKL